MTLVLGILIVSSHRVERCSSETMDVADPVGRGITAQILPTDPSFGGYTDHTQS